MDGVPLGGLRAVAVVWLVGLLGPVQHGWGHAMGRADLGVEL